MKILTDSTYPKTRRNKPRIASRQFLKRQTIMSKSRRFARPAIWDWITYKLKRRFRKTLPWVSLQYSNTTLPPYKFLLSWKFHTNPSSFYRRNESGCRNTKTRKNNDFKNTKECYRIWSCSIKNRFKDDCHRCLSRLKLYQGDWGINIVDQSHRIWDLRLTLDLHQREL